MILTRNSSGNRITTTRNKKKRNNKKRTSRKVFVITLLGIAVILTLILSPLFNISTIDVEGNSKISVEDIISASGIEKGINIFRADLSQAKTNISRMSYIDSIAVKRTFPGTINLLVKESKPIAYIPFIGSYICIDEHGKIVEVFSKLDEKNLPVILGLKFTEFEIGQIIKVEDEERLELVKMCIKEIINTDIKEQVTVIDVNNVNNIRLKVRDKIDVDLGDGSRINYRMSFLKSMLAELGEAEKGYIDLTNEDKVTFKASQ